MTPLRRQRPAQSVQLAAHIVHISQWLWHKSWRTSRLLSIYRHRRHNRDFGADLKQVWRRLRRLRCAGNRNRQAPGLCLHRWIWLVFTPRGNRTHISIWLQTTRRSQYHQRWHPSVEFPLCQSHDQNLRNHPGLLLGLDVLTYISAVLDFNKDRLSGKLDDWPVLLMKKMGH